MTKVDSKTFWGSIFDEAELKTYALTVEAIRIGPWRCAPFNASGRPVSWAVMKDGAEYPHGKGFDTRQEAIDFMVDDCLTRHDEYGQMTRQEILDRIEAIEASIATQDFTVNHTLVLGGEWQGLKKAIGFHGGEGVWAMVYRLRGI